MQRMVVTGATSMMGVALIQEALGHGAEVYAVVRKDSPKLSRLPQVSGLKLVFGDLESIAQWKEKIPKPCDLFYHFAWVGTGPERNKSVMLQSRNVYYTLEAVEAAVYLGCRRFIGAGSQAEYGPLDLPRIAPDTPAVPATAYGAAKLAAGELSRQLCRELGIEWIWPRIFSVYGIYEKETAMVASCLRNMLRGVSGDFTAGEQRWDYLYSRDAGRAYYLIGEKGVPGSRYCVGSGQARPLKEYICEMGRITGVYPEGIGRLPYPKGAVMNLCADIETLQRDTGFVPRFSFEEGIRETIAWLQGMDGGRRKEMQ